MRQTLAVKCRSRGGPRVDYRVLDMAVGFRVLGFLQLDLVINDFVKRLFFFLAGFSQGVRQKWPYQGFTVYLHITYSKQAR